MSEILKRHSYICGKCYYHWGTETHTIGQSPKPKDRKVMCIGQTLEEAFADVIPERCPFILEQTLANNDTIEDEIVES